MAVIRDFKDTHPDFEKFLGALDGMVADRLDANRLPVYAFDHPTIIFSKDSFSEWYRDVPSVNMRVNAPLELKEESPGRFVFDSDRFFPVDDKGFGNQGRAHNFHFTTEIRARFTYQGGEVFTYKGDDDVYVFVNGRLALDLGGVHFIMSETIDFDAMATALGIVKGGTYDLDVFHAERHTNDSNFRVETSIQCLVTNPVL